MALTLLDMFRNKTDEYERGVVETFTMECDISKKLPIETVGTLEVKTKRTNSIATVGFRRRGEMHGAVVGGTTDVVADAVYSMGATIDIDKADMRDKNVVPDPLSSRTREAVRGMAWTFNDAFMNGDHGTDEDSFEGVKVRLALANSAQTIFGVSASAELEARPGTATTANSQTLLDKIDEAVYACDGHTANVCLTGADFIRAVKSALRRLGINKDQPATEPSTVINKRRTGANFFQKPSWEYDGVAYYDMGLKADQSTQIVGTDTVNAIACRPAYFLKLGDPYIHGIQQYPMDIGQPKLLDDGVTYRTVIDWPIGLRHVHPRFGAKLKGVRVA